MFAPAKQIRALICLVLLAGASLAADSGAGKNAIKPTVIADWQAFDRLISNRGMTVQWISWTSSERGIVKADYKNRILSLMGEQKAPDGKGRVAFNGSVARIDKDEFIFNGTIMIADTPDIGRRCEKTDTWRFAITQNRQYWRLRQFEWCDGLTDYLDIYF